MTSIPPGKYFVSHSYADSEVRDKAVFNLPSHVVPVIFPPIRVQPHEFVSHHLIEAVLQADGLIYLKGGASASSNWVALERDYALRSGKPVFSLDPTTGQLQRENLRPLDLAVYASYCRADWSRVREVCDFLKEHRHFDVWLDMNKLGVGRNPVELSYEGMADALERGGYTVVFWSAEAQENRQVTRDLTTLARGPAELRRRVIFGLLEDVPIPFPWMQFRTENGPPFVQLFGDGERSTSQRLDDLIVRLYWLIHRNSGHHGDGQVEEQ